LHHYEDGRKDGGRLRQPKRIAIAITPNDSDVYVTSVLDMKVIATATNTVVATVRVGTRPGGLAITPNGEDAYVANGPGTVSVIDTATNTVVKAVAV
jgi:YVTN family beta-propeller protein